MTRNLLGVFGPLVVRSVRSEGIRVAEVEAARLRLRMKSMAKEGDEEEKEREEKEIETEGGTQTSPRQSLALRRLRHSAVVCLCKFMCVSSSFCSGGEGNPHLRLLFTTLRADPAGCIKR